MASWYNILGSRALAHQQVCQAQRRDLIAGHQRLESADVAALAATNGLAVVIQMHSDPFLRAGSGGSAIAVRPINAEAPAHTLYA